MYCRPRHLVGPSLSRIPHVHAVLAARRVIGPARQHDEVCGGGGGQQPYTAMLIGACDPMLSCPIWDFFGLQGYAGTARDYVCNGNTHAWQAQGAAIACSRTCSRTSLVAAIDDLDVQAPGSQATYNVDAEYGAFDIFFYFGTVSTRCCHSAMPRLTRRVAYRTRWCPCVRSECGVCWLLIGACALMTCPTHAPGGVPLSALRHPSRRVTQHGVLQIVLSRRGARASRIGC